MSENKDLLYQPQIGYKKNYYTEGTFEDEEIKTPSVTVVENPIIPVINNLITTIDKNLKWIPKIIKETYLSPYVALKDEYYRIANIEPEPDPIPEPKVIESTLEPEDDFPPDPFTKGADVYIDIKDPLRKRSNVINDKYKIDFLDVYKDYLEKLNTSNQNYIFVSLASLNMSDKNHNLKSYNSKDITNPDLLHLSDYLTKSSITFDQTTRLHKKLFNMDATILHVRGIRLAAKLIERYYDIDKLDKESDLEIMSNVLLTESKRVADKKYKENFYSLYKYLNSSVILMDESTNILLKQNKTILTLNKYEEKGNNDDTTTNK